jgi:hypothetical protein
MRGGKLLTFFSLRFYSWLSACVELVISDERGMLLYAAVVAHSSRALPASAPPAARD